MNGLLHHLALTLRLHFRNRMALFYGFLFPLIFLVAFWVLYRHERVPLVRHLGELLTVSVLGGACFGLPTSLVSERERGVWRRYRLAPLSLGRLLASTLVARYLLILAAGGLQLGLALALGMPWPAHAGSLWIAFTFVAFAFIGLGLVMAALANNVPAVQALGQCVFLPMLIIGGVAVPLAALPEWAQHVSAFFPGRYAVETLQACANGPGLRDASFPLLALSVIGAAGCVAGIRLFRWDPQQTFGSLRGKAWVALVLAAWLAVGLFAEVEGRILVASPAPEAAVPASSEPGEPVSPAATPETPTASPPPPLTPPPAPASADDEPEMSTPSAPAEPAPPPEQPRSWRDITAENLNAIRHFRVPPDHGVVAPFADPGEEADDYVLEMLDEIRERLPHWGPGRVQDPVQRVRNLLYVAAVPDAIQLPIERHVPQIVLDTLADSIPREDLVRILAWIVLNPMDGDDSAIERVNELGIDDATQYDVVRERAYYYAIKGIIRLGER